MPKHRRFPPPRTVAELDAMTEGAEHAEAGEPAWPIGLALVTLVVVTVLVALVSEIFVESVQKAAETGLPK